MKITKIEKVVGAIIIVLVLLLIVTVISIRVNVKKAGGIRKVAIEAGKDIKEIKKQINTE